GVHRRRERAPRRRQDADEPRPGRRPARLLRQLRRAPPDPALGDRRHAAARATAVRQARGPDRPRVLHLLARLAGVPAAPPAVMSRGAWTAEVLRPLFDGMAPAEP